jgi:ATP-dependent RNA helicase RhlE
MSFESFGLDRHLLQGVRDIGFVTPTPIQREAIPAALQGRDLLATAMTGSGKTAAFLLPILQRLLGRERGLTRALVVTPTRELAAQIAEEANALATHTPLQTVAIYGGVGMGPQEHALRTGVDIIVATPGRLLDHLAYPYTKLDRLEHLVLDEADRMLDMGFMPEIRKILARLPKRRQTLFFSATMPPEIEKLTKELLHQPTLIAMQRTAAPAVGITQAAYPVSQALKAALLVELVRRGEIYQALVFTRTKHRADRLTKFVQREQLAADRIHGNRSQAQRTAALDGFKRGKLTLLVATDIMARGIDVEALRHVVNFDVPRTPEDYIHRIGRTGRADELGDAFTFVAREEEGELKRIERVLGKTLPRVTLPDFDYNARPGGQLEVPLADRIKAIQAQKARERERSRQKATRRPAAERTPARKEPRTRPRPRRKR